MCPIQPPAPFITSPCWEAGTQHAGLSGERKLSDGRAPGKRSSLHGATVRMTRERCQRVLRAGGLDEARGPRSEPETTLPPDNLVCRLLACFAGAVRSLPPPELGFPEEVQLRE